MDIRKTKILLTGGGGFFGKHILNSLFAHGVPRENIFAPRSSSFDFSRMEDCRRAIRSCELVIHAAGVTGGRDFHAAHPGSVFYENLVMGVLLIEAAYRMGVKKFITIGSATEYPRHAPSPLLEKDLWNGFPEKIHAPYAIAKRALEVQGRAYFSEYGFRVIHLLMTAIYGPGAAPDSGPIPSLIKRVFSAKSIGAASVVAWGTGNSTRDFVYVDDAAEAIVLTAERYNKTDPLNIGSGTGTSIRDLILKINRILGYSGTIVFDTGKSDGQTERVLDISRAKEEIGFCPRTSLDVGLYETIRWYNKQYEQ